MGKTISKFNWKKFILALVEYCLLPSFRLRNKITSAVLISFISWIINKVSKYLKMSKTFTILFKTLKEVFSDNYKDTPLV